MENHNLRMRLMLEAEKEIVEGLSEAERFIFFITKGQLLNSHFFNISIFL